MDCNVDGASVTVWWPFTFLGKIYPKNPKHKILFKPSFLLLSNQLFLELEEINERFENYKVLWKRKVNYSDGAPIFHHINQRGRNSCLLICCAMLLSTSFTANSDLKH